MKQTFRVLLAGNPNCGKTSIFNALTGTRQHVGNYPGVTVESKSGRFSIGEREIELIDLPGLNIDIHNTNIELPKQPKSVAYMAFAVQK